MIKTRLAQGQSHIGLYTNKMGAGGGLCLGLDPTQEAGHGAAHPNPPQLGSDLSLASCSREGGSSTGVLKPINPSTATEAAGQGCEGGLLGHGVARQGC